MKRLLPIFLLFTITGCATLPLMESKYDSFDKRTITRLNNLPLETNNEHLSLSIVNIRYDDGENIYRLIIKYTGEDWFFIESGKSLVLLIDDTKNEFETDEGSLNNREVLPPFMGVVLVTESSSYNIDRETIKLLTDKTLRGRIYGQKYYIEFTVNDFGRKKINIFYDKYFLNNQ